MGVNKNRREFGKDKGFIFGVPARNLTKEEADIHGEYRLLKSGLYELFEKKEYNKSNDIQEIYDNLNKPKRKRVIKESE